MRAIFIGVPGSGKTTLFNALQGNYHLARKTQAVEFSDGGDIDTPGEYLSHPRLYHALINTLQQADLVIYLQAANDLQCRIPAGLLDIWPHQRRIAAISKIDLPDASPAAVRQLLRQAGFHQPIFELDCRNRASIQPLADFLLRQSDKEESADENINYRQ